MNQSELKEVLHYDPETGLFTWRVTRGGTAWAGSIAGCINRSTGYQAIKVSGKRYSAHRLAFLYMTGEWPPEHTDHINGVCDDNRWVNLRAVSCTENMRNQARYKNNKTGLVGVQWVKGHGKWLAILSVDSTPLYLGYFHSFFDACCARKSAEKRYGFHANHGRV